MTSKVRAVLQGQRVKFTLEAIEQANPNRVRVDWLRFTLPVDSFMVSFSPEFSAFDHDAATFESASRGEGVWRALDASPELASMAVQITTGDRVVSRSAQSVAKQAAAQLVERIGLFSIGEPEASGMDFYAARCAVVYEGATVGYVLAGGKSDSQRHTVHVNLFGSACLHLAPVHLERIAQWIDQLGGWITRTDLALDVWQGLDVTEVREAWIAGEFDVRGKRPGQKEHGSWTSGHSRTFEVGNRGTGKLMRAYEKGDELFGHEANDPWVRLEVELRNSHRIVETDVIRRPADYFAGAYPYCAAFLARLELGVSPQSIPTHAEVKDKTAEAAVTRVVRWITNTAAPALAAVWNLGGDMVAEVIEKNQHRQARRLAGFSSADIQAAFHQVARAIAPPAAPFAIGAGA